MLLMRVEDSLVSARFSRTKAVVQVANLLLAVVLAGCTLAAQSQKPAAPKTNTRFAAAIEQTFERGRDALLPPHVSTLLGISQEKEVPVKQFVEMAELIRGLDVSTADRKNVVIFVEKRAEKETTYYLTSKSGTLRKVLSVQEGVGHPRLPNKEDRKTFEQEKQTWVDKLAPKHP